MSFSPGGVDWQTVQDTLQEWVVAGSGLPDTSVIWGQQDAPRPAAPAIILRISNIAEIGQAWVNTSTNVITFGTLTVSAVDTAGDTLTSVGHGRLTGDGPVHLASTGTLPTAVGGDIAPNTDYWLIAPDADHLQLARTFAATGGGQGAGNPTTPIDLTGTGSGAITISPTPNTLRAGQELSEIARTYLRVTLELHCHSAPGVGINMATSILERVRARRKWSSQQSLLDGINVGLIEAERVRAVLGVRDALLFEPRAYLDVHFCVTAEENTTARSLESADILDQITGQTTHVGPT